MNKNIITELISHAKKIPTKPAFTFINSDNSQDIITYAELDLHARRIGNLLSSNLPINKSVIILLQPGINFITAFLGCLYSKFMAIPTYPPFNNHTFMRLKSVINNSAAQTVLTEKNYFLKIRKIFEKNNETELLEKIKWLFKEDAVSLNPIEQKKININIKDTAFIQYSSGSTSDPKGIVLTHLNLITNMDGMNTKIGAHSEISYISWLPPYHDMGLIGVILNSAYLGAHSVLMKPSDFILNPYKWLKNISIYKAEINGGPNFCYDYCEKNITDEQKKNLDLSCWKVAFNSAEAINPDTLVNFYNAFKQCGFSKKSFLPCYGLAEAGLLVSSKNHNDSYKTINIDLRQLLKNKIKILEKNNLHSKEYVSCGTVIDNHILKIISTETELPLNQSELGEICFSGDSVSREYFDNKQLSREKLNFEIPDFKGKRFVRTGDIGFIYQDELYITGRLKNIIKIRGKNIFSEDIEIEIKNKIHLKGILEIAAFSINKSREEQLIIIIELHRTLLMDKNKMAEISNLILKIIRTGFEINVHNICFVKRGTIIRASNGKIQRYKCSQKYLSNEIKIIYSFIDNYINDNSINTEQPATTEEIILADILKKILKINYIDRNQNIFEAGLDSLSIIQFITNAEDYNFNLTIDNLRAHNTIKELAENINWREDAYEKNSETSDNFPLTHFQMTEKLIEKLVGSDIDIELANQILENMLNEIKETENKYLFFCYLYVKYKKYKEKETLYQIISYYYIDYLKKDIPEKIEDLFKDDKIRYEVLSPEELYKRGFQEEDLIRIGIEIDNETIPNIEDPPDVEYWFELLRVNKEKLILLVYRNRIIGYIEFDFLSEKDYKLCREGMFDDYNMEIVKMSRKNLNILYFTMLGIKEKYRDFKTIYYLVDAFLEKLEYFAKGKVIFKSIIANAYTREGEMLSKLIGMKRICSHKVRGEIYELKMLPIDKENNFLKRKKDLIKIYEKIEFYEK